MNATDSAIETAIEKLESETDFESEEIINTMIENATEQSVDESKEILDGSSSSSSSERSGSMMEKLEAMASEVAQRENCRLYDIEYGNGPGGKVLRVSIDHPERPVGIEDCSNVSKGLNLILDTEDIVPGKYYLEVSSPGLERALKKAWHFESAIGKIVKLRTRRALGDLGAKLASIQPARQIKETLLAVEAGLLKFEIEGEVIAVPLEDVERAQLVFDYGIESGKENLKRETSKKDHPKKDHPKKDHPKKHFGSKKNRK